MKRSLFYLMAFAIVVIAIPPAQAQNINQMNFSAINVDNLSDEQIRLFMNEVRRTGLTDSQIDQVALAKGMSPAELQKLKARIAQLNLSDSSRLQSMQADTLGFDSTRKTFSYGATGDSLNNPFLRTEAMFDALRPKVFGEALFRNPRMSFEPNLNIPTPPNYQIGPQDEIVISIYGYSEANYRLAVSKEGSINIPYVGLVFVNGLTMAEATQRIKSKLSSVYSGIGSGRTSVQVSLGAIRSINVTLMGEVTHPGTYTLSSLATVFNALYAAGGPSANGSYRNIEIIRNSQVISTLDVYAFLMHGDQKGNVRLQDQDVIRIPTYDKQVMILGQVKRPGIFQLQAHETLADLLQYAGGFTDSAYTAMVKAVQLTGTQKKVSDIPASDFATFQPHTGDKYNVSAVLDRFTNRVIIDGAVYRSGPFELTDGLTLSQLIKKADGLREDAFLPRGYIVRQNPDLTSSSIQFDVAQVMNGSAPDIPLQREDVVHIYSIFDLRDEYAVTINGSVRQPGTYDYADSMTLEDLIMQAGGFTEGASPRRIEVSRRVVDSVDAGSSAAYIAQVFQENVAKDLKLNTSHFVLKPYDIVVVHDLPGYQVQKQVRVEGEVMYPGQYTLTQKDERISDLIKRAGGLTALAYPQGASLKRTGNLDSSALARQKLMRFEQLQSSLIRDSARLGELNNLIVHNDFVGIQLDKILKDPNEKNDLFLEGGDILYVPRRLQTIRVNGEVLYPVITPYKKGKNMRYYISQAGGFSTQAKKNRVYVVYANGFVRSTHNFLFFRNYPSVDPGAEIFVPLKPENKMNAQQIIGITSGVSALALAIVAILNVLK